ncbi:hypothetical protein R5R35_004811 [Gryllus longicercus]|uniref:Uncharacterized protein n=1 Tax=Gryllus longicercus TaxID=2509291 RepID=A0AAN9Z561_9ORTH
MKFPAKAWRRRCLALRSIHCCHGNGQAVWPPSKEGTVSLSPDTRRLWAVKYSGFASFGAWGSYVVF